MGWRLLVLLLCSVTISHALQCKTVSTKATDVSWWFNLKKVESQDLLYWDPNENALLDALKNPKKDGNKPITMLSKLFYATVDLAHTASDSQPDLAESVNNIWDKLAAKYDANNVADLHIAEAEAAADEELKADFKTVNDNLRYFQLWINDQPPKSGQGKSGLNFGKTYAKSAVKNFKHGHSKIILTIDLQDFSGTILDHSYPGTPGVPYGEEEGQKVRDFPSNLDNREIEDMFGDIPDQRFANVRKTDKFQRSQHAMCISFTKAELLTVLCALKWSHPRVYYTNIPIFMIAPNADSKLFNKASFEDVCKIKDFYTNTLQTFDDKPGFAPKIPATDDAFKTMVRQVLTELTVKGNAYLDQDSDKATSCAGHTLTEDPLKVVTKADISPQCTKGYMIGGKFSITTHAPTQRIEEKIVDETAKKKQAKVLQKKKSQKKFNMPDKKRPKKKVAKKVVIDDDEEAYVHISMQEYANKLTFVEKAPNHWQEVSRFLQLPLVLSSEYKGTAMPSVYAGKYPTVWNTYTVKIPGTTFSWPATREHGKYAIALDDKNNKFYFCVGDSNNQFSQATHAGIEICFENKQLHDTFSKSFDILLPIFYKTDLLPHADPGALNQAIKRKVLSMQNDDDWALQYYGKIQQTKQSDPIKKEDTKKWLEQLDKQLQASASDPHTKTVVPKPDTTPSTKTPKRRLPESKSPDDPAPRPHKMLKVSPAEDAKAEKAEKADDSILSEDDDSSEVTMDEERGGSAEGDSGEDISED